MFENVSRRQFVTGTAATLMGLGLVGCGGNGGGESAEGGDASGAIKVGIMGPHTGDNSSYGLACLNGAQLYFKQLNADGGVNGKQVEPVVYDEKGDATEAVNAYNSGDRVYLGSANVSGTSTELGDLATVDGRRVSSTLRYDSATGDGNVNLPFVKGMITYTYQEKEYQVVSMTNTSGVAYYYIPDGIESTVSFNNADGTYSEGNKYFACSDMVRSVSAGSSNTSAGTVTIQYVGYTDKDQENVVKQQSVTLDYDAELDFYEGDEPITMEAGVPKDLCPGEYEITIDGATGYYFSGTVYLYPGQTEFVGLDVVEVVTANIQKNESDAISIETEGSYHSFDGGYYLEAGYEYYITSTNRSDASDVKIAYGYVDLTGDSREAVTLDMKATQSVMEVTGYVGINADGTITVESGDVKRQFDVTDGAFTLRLPADMNDVTATVEVSATVASVEHWFTATEDLINMRDGCIRNISVLSSDAPADDSEEEDEPAFDAALARFSHQESAWSHLARALLLYKLGRMSAARRALHGYDELCRGGAYALLRPTYVEIYLPERPEVAPCSLEECALAVREAEPIIADAPDFIGWCQGFDWLVESAGRFAEKNDLDW